MLSYGTTHTTVLWICFRMTCISLTNLVVISEACFEMSTETS